MWVTPVTRVSCVTRGTRGTRAICATCVTLVTRVTYVTHPSLWNGPEEAGGGLPSGPDAGIGEALLSPSICPRQRQCQPEFLFSIILTPDGVKR
jgi:hypothetical protein